MTTPDIFAANFANSPDAFLNAPSGQSDGPRVVASTATIPASTVSGSVIGLVPFNKGASVQYGSQLAVADLDTGTDVTFEFGFVFDDDTTFTNDPNAFITSNTSLQTGGVVPFDAVAGATFVADADGWLAVTTGGGSTTTAGDITFNGTITYDV